MSRWSMLLAGIVLFQGCGDAEPFVPVQPPTSAAIVRIEIAAQASLIIGDTTGAVATAYDEDGTALALVSFLWSVADSAVATVTPGESTEFATVAAVAVGVTSLQATAGGVSSAPFAVTVAEPESPEGVEGPRGN